MEVNDNCAVKIVVRERCFQDTVEPNSGTISYPSQCQNMILVEERFFTFDNIIRPNISQQQLFDGLIEPLVNKVKNGFNCTVLAYGQTGTGKSYTMGLNINMCEGEHEGIIPRCLKEIIASNTENSPNKYTIGVSFVEIYNEKVYDLLTTNSMEPIASRSSRFTGGNIRSIYTIEDCYSILMQGIENRHVRPTKMNPQSSRSHAIFTIHVRSATSTSCLNLVDLAGSEGVRRTGHQGMAMSEGVLINQGLLSISKVLQAMIAKNKVIPYRDSVLSIVLQDSLKSNSYLTLLACVSSRSEDLSETLSTLRFAQSAKQLKRTPQMNTIIESKKNKCKTPHRTPLQTKNILTHMQSHKKPKSFRFTVSQVKKNGELLRHTICTPKKVIKMNVEKFNQSETAIMLKEKDKLETTVVLGTSNNLKMIKLDDNFDDQNSTNSVLLLNQSIDSRRFLLNGNISTSTAINATTSRSSYTPILSKCIEKFELIMDNKIRQIVHEIKNCESNQNLETAKLRTIEKPQNKTNQNNKTYTPIPMSVRKELKSIFDEFISDNQMQKADLQKTSNQKICDTEEKLTPFNPKLKSQLFTSSPLLKVPEISNSKPDISLCESTINVVDETEITNSFSGTVVKKTEINRGLRRSVRLQSIFRRNETETSVMESSMNITRATRKSMKQLYDERRQSVHRAMGTIKEENEKEKDKKKGAPTKNSFIAKYYDTSIKNIDAPKPKVTDHRKAVLNLLNNGSIKELQLLPKIGPKTAYQIITQRTLNGKFKSIAHIQKLPIWRGNAWEVFAKANILN